MDTKVGRLIQDSDTARKGENKSGCKQTDKDRQTKRQSHPEAKIAPFILRHLRHCTKNDSRPYDIKTRILWLLDHFY